MNYYKEIKEKIKDNEIYEKVKDYSKERHRVLTYFEIGRLLHEAGTHYGEGIISKYADLLRKDFGNKYDLKTLYRMKQLYIFFNEFNYRVFSSSQKVATPNTQSLKSPLFKGRFQSKSRYTK